MTLEKDKKDLKKALHKLYQHIKYNGGDEYYCKDDTAKEFEKAGIISLAGIIAKVKEGKTYTEIHEEWRKKVIYDAEKLKKLLEEPQKGPRIILPPHWFEDVFVQLKKLFENPEFLDREDKLKILRKHYQFDDIKQNKAALELMLDNWDYTMQLLDYDLKILTYYLYDDGFVRTRSGLGNLVDLVNSVKDKIVFFNYLKYVARIAKNPKHFYELSKAVGKLINKIGTDSWAIETILDYCTDIFNTPEKIEKAVIELHKIEKKFPETRESPHHTSITFIVAAFFGWFMSKDEYGAYQQQFKNRIFVKNIKDFKIVLKGLVKIWPHVKDIEWYGQHHPWIAYVLNEAIINEKRAFIKTTKDFEAFVKLILDNKEAFEKKKNIHALSIQYYLSPPKANPGGW